MISLSNSNIDELIADLKSLRDQEARMDQVSYLVTEPAIYEQMAEECCELGQALLKKARRIRGENYTPKQMYEIDYNLQEEFTDVILCALVLGLCIDTDIFYEKLSRWIIRNLDSEKGLTNENN